MTYTLTQFWFNLYALNSGQRLYDDWYQAFYNLLFTSLPVIVAGLLDQDVSKARTMHPQTRAVDTCAERAQHRSTLCPSV